MEENLEMCKEHVIKNKSLSQISEEHDNYNIGKIKYLVNLYKRYRDTPFVNRENGVYRRNTKLLAIR